MRCSTGASDPGTSNLPAWADIKGGRLSESTAARQIVGASRLNHSLRTRGGREKAMEQGLGGPRASLRIPPLVIAAVLFGWDQGAGAPQVKLHRGKDA